MRQTGSLSRSLALPKSSSRNSAIYLASRPSQVCYLCSAPRWCPCRHNSNVQPLACCGWQGHCHCVVCAHCAGETISEGGFKKNKVASASVLDIKTGDDKTGKAFYKYELLLRTGMLHLQASCHHLPDRLNAACQIVASASATLHQVYTACSSVKQRLFCRSGISVLCCLS